MKRSLLAPAVGLALVAALGLSACGSDKDEAAPSASTQESTPKADSADVDETSDDTSAKDTAAEDETYAFTEDTVASIFADLGEAIGTEDPTVVSVNVYADTENTDVISYVIVEAVDPANPEELNEWQWRDGKVDPQSTPIDFGEDLEALADNVYQMSELNPAAIAAAPQAAVTAAEVSDGTAAHVTISRIKIAAGDPSIQMQVSVSGERSSKTVRLDTSGTVLDVF